MGINKKTAVFAGFYLFAYAAVACMSNYFNVFLETSRGFTGTQLGVFNGLANLSTVFVLPFMGVLVKRLGGYHKAQLLFCGITAASILLMQWQYAVAGLIVLGCVEATAKSCSITAADTQITDYCSRSGGNYGALRSFGSIGYTLGGIILGFLAVRLTLERTLIPVTVGCLLLVMAAAVFFPGQEQKKSGESQADSSPHTMAALKELAQNRHYRFLIFITLFSAYTLDCNGNYIGNHLVSTLGAPESIISLNTACCVIPEILFLPLVSRTILPKYGYKALYRVSAVVLILRCVFYLFVDDPRLFILGSLLHCVAIGCNPVAGLAFAGDVTRPQIYGTAVAVYVMCEAIGRAAYGYINGWIYESFGSRAIFVFLLAINLISAVVIFTSRLFDGVGTEKTQSTPSQG